MDTLEVITSDADLPPSTAAQAVPPPTLSVVIPAYNVERFVRAAVESALAQTLSDLEVIVVNDGSTDNTLAVLQEMQRVRADPRLRVISQANAGLAAARNTGVLEAIGEFIGLLDADDVWAREKASLQLAVMRVDPTVGITFCQSAYINEDGEPTGTVLAPTKREPSLHDMVRRNHLGNGSTPIIRRKCFLTAGLFCTELRSCEDYEMWCRMMCRTSFRAVLVPLPLTHYRIRHSSLSFDTGAFTRSADKAMAMLKQSMPDLPRRVLRAGHAEHYRIAAWKAASSGRKRLAMPLLGRALRLRPSLLVLDWRALGTMMAIALPFRLQGDLVRLAKAAQEFQIDKAPREAPPQVDEIHEGALLLDARADNRAIAVPAN